MVAVSGKTGSSGGGNTSGNTSGVAADRSEVLARFLEDGPANSDGPQRLGAAPQPVPTLEKDILLDQGSRIGNGVLNSMRRMAGEGVTRLMEVPQDSRLPVEERIARDVLGDSLGPVVDGRNAYVERAGENSGISSSTRSEFQWLCANLN